MRHVFTGGKLNENGSESATDNVLLLGASCQSFRKLLGIQEPEVPLGWSLIVFVTLLTNVIQFLGKVTMHDCVRGRPRRGRPEGSHIGRLIFILS